jgi:two-component system cell cycle sensor histidine kinase/response regulator CckA
MNTRLNTAGNETCSPEELLRLSKREEHLRITLASIGDAVIATDDKGRITSMNPVAEALTGWTEEKALGKDLHDVFHIMNAKTREPVENPISLVLASKKTVGLANHTILISKKGVEHQIADSAAPIQDSKGHISGVILVFRDVTREYKAEAALRESESRYRGLIDLAVDGILLGDPKGLITDANQCMSTITGLPKNDLIGRHITDLPFTQKSLLDSPLRFDLLQKGEIVISERVLIRPDGSEVVVEMRSKMMPDGSYQSIYRDITERKKAAKFLKLILDNIPDFVFWKDRNSVFLGCNNNIARAAGLNSPDDIIGKTDFDLGWKKEESDFFVATDRRIMESNTAEYHIIEPQRQADGKEAWLDTCKVPLHDEQGQVIGILGTFVDITERKKMEEALRESESSLHTILQSTADGILAVDSENKVLSANARFAEMWNIPPALTASRDDAALLHHVLDQLANPQEFLNKVQEVYKSTEDSFDTLNFKNGRVFERLSRPLIRENKPNGRVWSFRDVTARKIAEEREKELLVKLERSARMESLGVLAGGVAHDLNNILGPIVALPDVAIEYLHRHGNPADPDFAATLDSLHMMKSSALRAASVVSDLVVLGRRAQFQKKSSNLNRVAEHLLESKPIKALQARRPDVTLSTRLMPESPWCQGSESRLARILENLTSNAVEAISGNGEVIISTSRMMFANPYQGYELIPAGDYVTLEVKDTGCGMDAKTIARIFEPFYSTKSPTERSGSGLGLSVVHGLVKDHTGFLDVKSTPNKGSTFTVFLPAVTAEEESPPEKDPCRLPGGTERILVVDDEPGQRFLAQVYLTKMGYDVTVVSSGTEAVALFETAGCENKAPPYDLVLTDMVMEGLDGLATCRAILERYPSQKLVIMSGQIPDGYAHQITELAAEWLNKPFTPIELARAIRLRLDRH